MFDKNFINEDELVTLISELDNSLDVISGLFDKIDQTISGLPDCYKASASEAIMLSYQEFRKNYKIIKNGLQSYSEDYIALIQKMKSGDTSLSKMLTNFATDTKEKAKKVNV